MKKILVIESSPRWSASVSRQLTQEVVARLLASYPGSVIRKRDLAASPLPHLGLGAIEASFQPPEELTAIQKEALRLSDEIVDEVLYSDIIVLGTPMWNLNIPSAVKAWIDHLVRIGKTLGKGADGYKGLIVGKKVYVIATSGGVFSEGPFKAYDFLEPYLRSILGLLGMTDVVFVRAEGLDYSQTRDAGMEKARRGIKEMVA